MKKTCTKCKVEKEIDLFYTNRFKPMAWCKDCSKAYQKQRKRKPVKSKFKGLVREFYDLKEMLEAEGR